MTLPEQRAKPAERATALWRALKRAKDGGLTAGEAADRKIASVVYARKTMRAWVAAGLARYEPSPVPGSSDPGRYFIGPGAAMLPPMVRADGSVAARVEPAMKPAELATIRRKLDLSLGGMASALGWTGSQPTRARAIKRFEQGERPIDQALADRIRALANAPTPLRE